MSDIDRALSQAKSLAQTPQGQLLAQRLRELGGPGLDQALDQAARGDLTAARSALSRILADPGARQLLQQLGGSHGSES